MHLMRTKKIKQNTLSSNGIKSVLVNEKYLSSMQKEHTVLSAMRDAPTKERLSTINKSSDNSANLKNFMAVLKKQQMKK